MMLILYDRNGKRGRRLLDVGQPGFSNSGCGFSVLLPSPERGLDVEYGVWDTILDMILAT